MTPRKKAQFVNALSSHANVSKSCISVGITRQCAYHYRELDPDFKRQWDEAIEAGTDALVEECYRRAYEGVPEPVFYQGEQCGEVQKFSDTLAIFLLKSHRPAVYRETVRNEHTGKDGGPVESISMTTTEWREQAAKRRADAEAALSTGDV